MNWRLESNFFRRDCVSPIKCSMVLRGRVTKIRQIANFHSDKTRAKPGTHPLVRDKMKIGDDLKITKCHRLSHGSNAPVLVVCILIAKRKELGERGIKSKLRDNKLFVNDKVCKVMNGQVVDSTGDAI
ncbi:hypothetical protein LAZ67_3003639 [Cordylochernes scorpioides]|uniref:Uncharacterized protein n=1 Tax=Cordylochernes scorpioides TaxID=51811 RepID=A0ABY6K8T8_9ARAC|nr:hypothetical protein LAZ67_3003639 [Cordylochernes scorpioides]